MYNNNENNDFEDSKFNRNNYDGSKKDRETTNQQDRSESEELDESETRMDSRKTINEHSKKERDKSSRMNIYVPPDMSEEWKEWAESLGSSVSELVRKSMRFVKNNIKDLKKLEAIGIIFDQLGDKIDEIIEESGIEDLEDELKKKIGKVKIDVSSGDVKYRSKNKKYGARRRYDATKKPRRDVDKERMKMRVKGLIKLQNSIPVEKLAQILDISNEDAENIIYEIAAEGIDGVLEENVFKFSNQPEEVINSVNEIIEKI